MNRIFHYLPALVLLSLVIMVSGCQKSGSDSNQSSDVVPEKTVKAVTEVTLDKTSLTLKAGQSATLTASVKPDDATDKSVTWSTSDPSVATVSEGTVTALKVGTATITAKAGDKTAACSVTVESTSSGDLEDTGEEDIDL